MGDAKTRHVRQVRFGDHLCLPFANDDEQREVVSTYVADGLTRGERVLYVADQTGPESIDRWLDGHGVDGALAVARGQLRVCSTGDDCDPLELLATIGSDRLAGPYQGVRLTGEMSWALRQGDGRLKEYEDGVSTAVDSGGLMAICQYDQRLFDRAELDGLMARHPSLVQVDPLHDDRRLRIVPTFAPRGLKVIGTVDSATVDGLAKALAHAATWPERVLDIDLAELEFIDVAGVRTIVRAAESLPPHRRLRLRNLAPTLRRVIGIVGWDRTPGLTIGDEVDAT